MTPVQKLKALRAAQAQGLKRADQALRMVLDSREVADVIAREASAGTTVSATLLGCQRCAPRAIRVLATGGIGGVHRGAGTTGDVSAEPRQRACGRNGDGDTDQAGHQRLEYGKTQGGQVRRAKAGLDGGPRPDRNDGAKGNQQEEQQRCSSGQDVKRF